MKDKIKKKYVSSVACSPETKERIDQHFAKLGRTAPKKYVWLDEIINKFLDDNENK